MTSPGYWFWFILVAVLVTGLFTYFIWWWHGYWAGRYNPDISDAQDTFDP